MAGRILEDIEGRWKEIRKEECQSGTKNRGK